jgi:hypothetical protein
LVGGCGQRLAGPFDQPAGRRCAPFNIFEASLLIAAPLRALSE